MTAVQLVLEQKHEEAITFTIKEFRRVASRSLKKPSASMSANRSC